MHDVNSSSRPCCCLIGTSNIGWLDRERDAFQTSGDGIMFVSLGPNVLKSFGPWKDAIKMPMVLDQCDQMDKSKRWTWKFWMLWQMPPIQPGYLACHSWNLMCHLFLERPSLTFLGQVDPLSLSCLLSHGFEEGPARRALRKTMNDTQVGFEAKKTWKRGFGGWIGWIFQGISRGISHDSVWGWIRKNIQTLF